MTIHYRPEDEARARKLARGPYELSAYRYRVVELDTGRVLSEGQTEGSDFAILSPDPSTYVLETQDMTTPETTVSVRDLATGKERRRFCIDPSTTVSGGVLGLTPDGKQLLGVFGLGGNGGQHGDVAPFSLATGKEVARIKTGPQSHLIGSAFSPSGRNAAVFGACVSWLWAINEAAGRSPTPAAPRPSAAPPVRWTEGKIRDVAVGGGGRYLALMLADARKVAIFDVTATDVVKTIPLASDDALIAAGARKLVIAYSGARRLERWDLETLKRDGELRPSPIDGVLQAIAIGSDSDGPLLACWSVATTDPPFTLKAQFSFIDLDSLKVLKVGLGSSTMGDSILSRSGGGFLACLAGKPGVLRLSASAGGSLFGLWLANKPLFGDPAIIRAEGNTVSGIRRWDNGTGVGYLIPGADG